MVAATNLFRLLPTAADLNLELPDVVEDYNVRTSEFHGHILPRISVLSVRHNKLDSWLPSRGKEGGARREQ
jgi:hypothetical protein